MKLDFKLNNKKFDLEVKTCKSVFSKALGLMFKNKSLPLLFIFKKPTKTSIHSFFCKPFIAIWFLGDEIVDMKLVENWRFSIKPKKNFNKLLEIPSNNEIFSKLKMQ
jgi:uncharacterized membrane protein (UPF0127 family)